MLVVDALSLIFIKRWIRSLMLKNEMFTQRNKHKIIILINTNNEKIFISQSFIKNAQIFEFKYTIIMMRAIDDYKIFFYNIYDFAFSLADNEGKKQKRILKTYIVNMREYDLIFDYS